MKALKSRIAFMMRQERSVHHCPHAPVLRREGDPAPSARGGRARVCSASADEESETQVQRLTPTWQSQPAYSDAEEGGPSRAL